MGKIFYTSDLHISHANVIRFDNRPYESVAEMDEALIKNWNEVVKPNDEVYILGDFAFQNSYMTLLLYRYFSLEVNAMDPNTITATKIDRPIFVFSGKGKEFLLLHVYRRRDGRNRRYREYCRPEEPALCRDPE